MNNKKSLGPMFWVFALVFAVRVYVLMQLNNSSFGVPENGDMKFYSDWAVRILHGQWTDHKSFYGLPGYAFLLAGIYSLAGFNPFFVGLLQAAVDGAIGIVILQFCRELLPARRGIIAGFLAASGWALFQPAQTFSSVLMPTVWLVLAFWGCALWAVKAKGKILVPWFPLGICVGLVCTMVATILFILPLAAAVMIVRLRSVKIAVALPLMVAGVFIGASPCWVHNYFVAREPVLLSAHSGLNFYIGNNEVANGYPKMPPGMSASQQGMLRDSITMAETATGRPLTHAQVSEYWSAKAHDYIKANPEKWRKLMFTKFCNAWSARQYDDLSLITLFSEEGLLLPGPRFGLIAVLGLAGFVLAMMANRKAGWVFFAVVLHLSALMPVFITERYRMAAIPGLLILAAVGMSEFVRLLQAREWGRPLVYLVVLGTAWTGVFWSDGGSDIRVTDAFNVGLRQCDGGSMERAKKNLTFAYENAPDNPEINFALGNFWMKEKNVELSKGFFLNTITLNPRHSAAFNNLSVLAISEKNWPLAEKFVNKALESEPNDVRNHLLLSLIFGNEGNFKGAEIAIDEALRLKPQSESLIEMRKKIRAHDIPSFSEGI